MKRVALAVLLAGCSSPPVTFAGLAAIPLHGRATYADGTPAASVQIQVDLLATGDGLFPAAGSACTPGDPHAQALQTVSVFTGPDGSLSLEVPMTGFVRATDDTCPMPAQAAATIDRIDLRIQAEADFSSCLPYCRKHSAETCYSDCAGRGQKFVWVSSITAADLGASARIHFDKLGPPIAGTSTSAPPLPDLRIDGAAAQRSLQIGAEDFAADSCVLQDKCIGAAGTRTLLRFDGVIQNLGTGDLRIGSPENNPLFSWSACHGHYHLTNIMTFELLDENGQPVSGDTGELVVHKQGVCMEGIEQIAGNASSVYDCGNQGLEAGWEDIYSARLNCQWLDVTGVRAGDYHLRITANASRIFPESNFDNNVALVPVSIP